MKLQKIPLESGIHPVISTIRYSLFREGKGVGEFPDFQ